MVRRCDSEGDRLTDRVSEHPIGKYDCSVFGLDGTGGVAQTDTDEQAEMGKGMEPEPEGKRTRKGARKGTRW